MASYTATHTCGHTEMVQLYGPGHGREYRLLQLSRERCHDCKIRAQHAAAVEAAKSLRGADRLPALQGSDSQIAWATDIRVRLLTEIDAMISEVDAHGDSASQEMVRLTRQLASQMSQASWWIDRRRDSAITLMGRIAKSVVRI